MKAVLLILSMLVCGINLVYSQSSTGDASLSSPSMNFNFNYINSLSKADATDASANKTTISSSTTTTLSAETNDSTISTGLSKNLDYDTSKSVNEDLNASPQQDPEVKRIQEEKRLKEETLARIQPKYQQESLFLFSNKRKKDLDYFNLLIRFGLSLGYSSVSNSSPLFGVAMQMLAEYHYSSMFSFFAGLGYQELGSVSGSNSVVLKYWSVPLIFQVSYPAETFLPYLAVGIHPMVALQGQAIATSSTDIYANMSPVILDIEVNAGFTLIFDLFELKFSVAGIFSPLSNISTAVTSPFSISVSNFHSVILSISAGI